MSYKPTAEQDAIVEGGLTGDDITIEAGAGTGKTSTLKLFARAAGRKRGAYLAYNRSIATDAAKQFPSTVVCKTAHSFAYGTVGRQYAHRLNGPRVPARQAAIILGLNEPLKLGEAMLAPQQLARLVTETIQRFCYSDDRQVQRMHVPLVNGLDRPGQAELARYLVPIAQRAWDDDLTQLNGQLRFTHDMYLKLWILSDPVIHADYVLLDEAQDSNPAVAGLVSRQPAQRILFPGAGTTPAPGPRAVPADLDAMGERYIAYCEARDTPGREREADLLARAVAEDTPAWLGEVARIEALRQELAAELDRIRGGA